MNWTICFFPWYKMNLQRSTHVTWLRNSRHPYSWWHDSYWRRFFGNPLETDNILLCEFIFKHVISIIMCVVQRILKKCFLATASSEWITTKLLYGLIYQNYPFPKCWIRPSTLILSCIYDLFVHEDIYWSFSKCFRFLKTIFKRLSRGTTYIILQVTVSNIFHILLFMSKIIIPFKNLILPIFHLF